MALSDYKLYIRKSDETKGTVTTAHALYTSSEDISDGMFAQLKTEDDEVLYLPITTNLNSYYASSLRFRNKVTGQVYAGKTEFSPFDSSLTIDNHGYLYNLSGSVPGNYYNLGSLPFVIQDKDKPLVVSLRLSGRTNTWGGWADQVYTKIGIHIDEKPYMILEYASYGKSGVIEYDNTLIADRLAYPLSAGPHTVGLCIWAKCTSKDHNDCYIDSVTINLESEGV